MGASISKKSKTIYQQREPPSYTECRDEWKHDQMDTINSVIKKYVGHINSLPMNAYLNENLIKQIQLLLKMKTNMTPCKDTLVLLCSLYAAQIKKHGEITEYYTNTAFYIQND